MNSVPVLTPAEIEEVARLARVIWRGHYASLIGDAQVDYMLTHLQSAPAIGARIREGDAYFLIEHDGTRCGYFATRAEPGRSSTFLSKLYVLDAMRGLGLGAKALREIETASRTQGLSGIWLTVHKRNPTVRFYEHQGFQIMEPVVTEIGGGFLMDDYRMYKAL